MIKHEYKRMIKVRPQFKALPKSQPGKRNGDCIHCATLKPYQSNEAAYLVKSLNVFPDKKRAYMRYCTKHAAQKALFYLDSLYIGPYELEYLEKLPTISQGQFDNLKIETEHKGQKRRVWLSRMTVADGMPYNNQVTVEQYSHQRGAWETKEQYQAL